MNLKIEPEFQNKIPPLTEDEFKQLEENILNDGEVYEPIVTWNSVIVDGHNRWKIILANPWLTYKVKEMKFADKWEAFDWMYKKQLGRRNLTDEQKTVLIGEMYRARKHQNRGGQIGNKNASKRCDQADNIVSTTTKQNRVAEQIAEELNVSPASVVRAEQFVNGLEMIREEEPELADSILNSQKKVSKQAVRDIGQARPEVRKSMIETIKTGGESKKKRSNSDQKELNNIVDSMSDDSVMQFTVDMLTEQIRFNAAAFTKSLCNLLDDHRDLCDAYGERIGKSIDCIINEIKSIKETLNNGTQL